MPKKYHGHPKMHEHKKEGGSRPMRNGDTGEDHMIKNDNSKIANMPQDIKMEQYPYPSMMDENYNDGISGIDHQMGEDHGKLRSQYKPHKF